MSLYKFILEMVQNRAEKMLHVSPIKPFEITVSNMEDREKGHEYYWVRKCSAIKNFADRTYASCERRTKCADSATYEVTDPEVEP